jgi:hypothetical protein
MKHTCQLYYNTLLTRTAAHKSSSARQNKNHTFLYTIRTCTHTSPLRKVNVLRENRSPPHPKSLQNKWFTRINSTALPQNRNKGGDITHLPPPPKSYKGRWYYSRMVPTRATHHTSMKVTFFCLHAHINRGTLSTCQNEHHLCLISRIYKRLHYSRIVYMRATHHTSMKITFCLFAYTH